MREQIDTANYKRYIADSLFFMSRNMSLNYKYSELKAMAKAQTKSADEVAADIIKRAGIKVKV